jgi:leucyl-tRNA synthetase
MVTHETYWVVDTGPAGGAQDGYWVAPDEIETGADGQLIETATGKPVTLGRIEKMSKSKKNTVDPMPMFDQFGADAVRWFMLSDSPPERDLPWSEAGIEATWRFVQRLWRLFSSLSPSPSGVDQSRPPDETERSTGLGWGPSTDADARGESPPPAPPLKGRGDNAALDSALHRAIAGIGADIEALGFNKAVAKVHALANEIEKAPPSESRAAAIRTLIRLIAPMLPHLAEEAWALIGGEGLVVSQPWPDHDPALLVETQATIAVQVAGKLRDTLIVPADATREQLEAAALASEKIIRTLDGATPKKVIVVPGRLVNIVI